MVCISRKLPNLGRGSAVHSQQIRATRDKNEKECNAARVWQSAFIRIEKILVPGTSSLGMNEIAGPFDSGAEVTKPKATKYEGRMRLRKEVIKR
jgi:hypothetical protein